VNGIIEKWWMKRLRLSEPVMLLMKMMKSDENLTTAEHVSDNLFSVFWLLAPVFWLLYSVF
jgi:hypothetical protein